VVGAQRHIYDVFGPAVHRAQRLRWEVAEPMTIAADAAFAGELGRRFALTPLGERDLGGGAGPVFRLGEAVAAAQGRGT
jgi:class 3 adenylate cyclase